MMVHNLTPLELLMKKMQSDPLASSHLVQELVLGYDAVGAVAFGEVLGAVDLFLAHVGDALGAEGFHLGVGVELLGLGVREERRGEERRVRIMKGRQ